MFDVPARAAPTVMAALDPAIYTGTVPRIVTRRRAATDGRVKPGHDGWGGRCTPSVSRTLCGLVYLDSARISSRIVGSRRLASHLAVADAAEAIGEVHQRFVEPHERRKNDIQA